MPKKNPLTDPHTLIIFTTAPAGLGHLRVTQALMDGLPAGLHSFMLGSVDKTMTFIHRLSSVNPVFLRIQNFIQYQPFAETTFTNSYREYLRNNCDDIKYQLTTLLHSHQPKIKKAVIVATHFGLAHQIAALKPGLAQETGVEIILSVIVTDDTFQKIWAVDGADILIVPSLQAKEKFSDYFNSLSYPKPKIVVNPYPLAPALCGRNENFIRQRKLQLDPQHPKPTQVIIPISGAAVQLEYLRVIIEHLYKIEDKLFIPTVIAKQAPFTDSFLHYLQYLTTVRTVVGNSNADTINNYQKMFLEKDVISLEITKPSEQTFKALLTPRQAGGILFLFTQPVGRQEYDNIRFLHRHHLLPNATQQQFLLKAANKRLGEIPSTLLEKARSWRGVILPRNPFLVVPFIYYLRQKEIFKAMLSYRKKKCHELEDNGVELFWERLGEELENSK